MKERDLEVKENFWVVCYIKGVFLGGFFFGEGSLVFLSVGNVVKFVIGFFCEI